MSKVKKNDRNRIYGLDLLRILSALCVFLFHAQMHIKCDFGPFNSFISMGAIFMVCFFMLSGFSLFYTYGNLDFSNIKTLKVFYLKRLLGIYPLYIVIYIMYLIIFNDLSLIKNLVVMPIEITLTQSVYESLFSVLHNGGTV